MVTLDGGSAEPQPQVPAKGSWLPQQRVVAPPAAPEAWRPVPWFVIRPMHRRRPTVREVPAVAIEAATSLGSTLQQRLTGVLPRRAVRLVREWPWAVRAIAASVFAAVALAGRPALPWVTVVLFVLIGITTTHPRYLLQDATVVGSVVVLVLLLAGSPAWTGLSLGLVLLGTIVLGFVLHRDRDEVVAAIGGAAAADALLTELRERIGRRRQAPLLPPEWSLQSDLRAARGDGFCGDFIAIATDPGQRLDIALVDVSGKGSAAGARAVLLSGALEALLNAVPQEQFLPAANDHVLRIGDAEGFATAVHASVDLVSGRFLIAGAGHPPAVHYRAGAGRWQVLDDEQGPALGLLNGPGYPCCRGQLARGDLLLLYTDGLVESRKLDVSRGIDRLVGHAEAVLARGVGDLAAAIAEAIRAEDGDDRALVVIRRT